MKRAGRKSLLVGDKRKRENKKRIKKEIVPRKQWNPYKMNPKTKRRKQYRNIQLTKNWHWTLRIKLQQLYFESKVIFFRVSPI